MTLSSLKMRQYFFTTVYGTKTTLDKPDNKRQNAGVFSRCIKSYGTQQLTKNVAYELAI